MKSSVIIIDASVIIDAIHSGSDFHSDAYKLLEKVKKEGKEVLIPAHGLFEIQSTMKRITSIESEKVSSKFNSELKAIRLNPVAIDLKFIDNFYDVELPYAKAGDTIYMVMAKKLNLPLITRDNGMYKISKQADINVYTVEEALSA